MRRIQTIRPVLAGKGKRVTKLAITTATAVVVQVPVAQMARRIMIPPTLPKHRSSSQSITVPL